jgi:uncharacterized protein YndB with AHSA1/START domain
MPMTAYQDVLAIDAGSTERRLARAADILASHEGVVLLDGFIALRPMRTHLLCEVLDPSPGAHRCANEYEVLLENAQRALQASKLRQYLPGMPWEWTVVKESVSGTERVWPDPGESTAEREFVHSRLIDAPQEQVFRALADPAHLARWWGPDGFSSTFEVFDFQPGGRWLFVMHGPDGTNYPNENIFREIVAPGRVVIEHPARSHHFILTITLTACGNQTRVGWRQVFDDAAHRDSVAAVVEKANEQNLDRLATEVRNVSPPEADS